MLYVLILEPLLKKIRQDSAINGTCISGACEPKEVTYADDTNILQSTIDAIRRILYVFSDFEKASGSKINIAKSHLMGIGMLINSADFPFDMMQINQLKLYGIMHSAYPHDNAKVGWKEMVRK